MEGEGEVLYGTEAWDPRLLDGLGQMRPAGPLYNIDCFKGSVSHLHLPHCEIQHGRMTLIWEFVLYMGGNNIVYLIYSTRADLRVSGFVRGSF